MIGVVIALIRLAWTTSCEVVMERVVTKVWSKIKGLFCRKRHRLSLD